MMAFRKTLGASWQSAMQGPARLLLWLSVASLLAYGIVMPEVAETKHIILKSMGVGLLSLSAFATLRKADGVLLGLALAFGALGDALIAQNGGFLNGLAAFLVGHLIYITLFIRHRRSWGDMDLQRKFAIFLLVTGAVVLSIGLAPYIGALKTYVNVYTLVLTAMAVAAFISQFNILVRIGAVSFLISDALIAVGRFAAPASPDNPFWTDLPYVIWATYALAQLFIYLGVSARLRANNA